MTSYIPLWCKSSFSFLEGASQPEELAEACSILGIEALAITDRDGVYGVVEGHVKAKEAGVKLIIGSEMTIEDGTTIVLIAMDRKGYANLCGLITKGRMRSLKGESKVSWQEIFTHAEGLIALWGGDRSLLTGSVEPFFVAHDLREAFKDSLYALAVRHRRAEDKKQEARLRKRAERYGLPVVAGIEVLYHHGSRRDLQDIMTCIRHKASLSEAGRRIKPNAEHALKPPHLFATLFADDPDAVARTREIAAQCTFSLDELRYRYPSERLP
ncbi:PHP domain-containing protein, partial [Acidobacteriota bacterium]